uniref:Uncharacterized protein n=1 Tax=Cacopsylla melanoneura TaxID=428564 RepID=A0A8D8LM22_9HEMI
MYPVGTGLRMLPRSIVATTQELWLSSSVNGNTYSLVCHLYSATDGQVNQLPAMNTGSEAAKAAIACFTNPMVESLIGTLIRKLISIVNPFSGDLSRLYSYYTQFY